jgi:holo-[acyl-carrier protein] synthase
MTTLQLADREVAIGTDLVLVKDVQAGLQAYGERYFHRIYTEHEIATCLSDAPSVAAARFAARFAGKEAVLKLLACEDHQPEWRSIEIRRRKSGHCVVVLWGSARILARDRGIETLGISLSHEGAYAIAVVVATTIRPRTQLI